MFDMIAKAQALYNQLQVNLGKSQLHPYKSDNDYIMAKLAELSSGYVALKSLNADMMLGMLPLFGVQDYEVARSTDEINFRAMKGQFFRQQEGDEFAAVINMTLTGQYRNLVLTAIEYLYLWSHNNKDKMVYKDYTYNNNGQFSHTDYEPVKLKEIGDLGYDVPDNDWFNTFTVVTRNDVLFDIYIENFEYDRSVKSGQNVINVSLFCKKFIPGDVHYVSDYTEKSKELYDVKVKDKTSGVLLNDPNNREIQVYREKFYNVTELPDGIRSFKDKTYGTTGSLDSIVLNTYGRYSQTARTEQFVPDKAEWYDLAIRSGFRLISTAQRFAKIYRSKDTSYLIRWSTLYDRVSNTEPVNVVKTLVV